jgi:hypothetical protein
MRKFKINKSIVRAASVLLSASMMLTPMAAYAEGEPAAQEETVTTADETPAPSLAERADAALDLAVELLDAAEQDITVTSEDGTISVTNEASKAVEFFLDASEYHVDKVDEKVEKLDEKIDTADAAVAKAEGKIDKAEESIGEAYKAIGESFVETTEAKIAISGTDGNKETASDLADTNKDLADTVYANAEAAATAKATAGQNAALAVLEVNSAEEKVGEAWVALEAAGKEVFEANANVYAADKAVEAAEKKVAAATRQLNDIKWSYGLNDWFEEYYAGDAQLAINDAKAALVLAEKEYDQAVLDQATAVSNQQEAQGIYDDAKKAYDASNYILEALNAGNELTEFFNGSYRDRYTDEIVGYYWLLPIYAENPDYHNNNKLHEYDIKDVKALIGFQLYKNGFDVKDISFVENEDNTLTVSYKDADGNVITSKCEYTLSNDNKYKRGEQDHWIDIDTVEIVQDGTKKVPTGETETTVDNYTIKQYGDEYIVDINVFDDTWNKEILHTNKWNGFYGQYYNEYRYYKGSGRNYVEYRVKEWLTQTPVMEEVPNMVEQKTDLINEPEFWHEYKDFDGTAVEEAYNDAKDNLDTANEELVKANLKVEAAAKRVEEVKAAYEQVVAAMATLKELEVSTADLAQAQRNLAIAKSQVAWANLGFTNAWIYFSTLYWDVQGVKAEAQRAQDEANRDFRYITRQVPDENNTPVENNEEDNTPETVVDNTPAAPVRVVTTAAPAAPAQEVEITEEPAPLAETPAVTETVVEENKTPLAAPEVTVTEEPAPLAEAPVETARISWLWLLVILALVAAAAEGFRRYMKKAKANK